MASVSIFGFGVENKRFGLLLHFWLSSCKQMVWASIPLFGFIVGSIGFGIHLHLLDLVLSTTGLALICISGFVAGNNWFGLSLHFQRKYFQASHIFLKWRLQYLTNFFALMQTLLSLDFLALTFVTIDSGSQVARNIPYWQ